MNRTGIYKLIDGKVIKISNKVPSIKKIPDWAKTMNPDLERKMGYASLERQGKLKEVDDKECYEDLL